MTKNLIAAEDIQSLIFTIRNQQVMIDKDLADIYGVEVKRLNEQVKRNMDRFPKEFMFQLTKEEMDNWKSRMMIADKEEVFLRSQFATSMDAKDILEKLNA